MEEVIPLGGKKMSWKEDKINHPYVSLEEAFKIAEEVEKNPPKTPWDLTVRQRIGLNRLEEFMQSIEYLTYY
jgi:hypothetical protein